MSSTITFKIMSNDDDHQLQLAEELCNWDNFSGSLVEITNDLSGTPLYYFDSSNTKRIITDATSFAAMLFDSGKSNDNIIHLYSGNISQDPATATTSEWVFAPEEETLDSGVKRSTQPGNGGMSFSEQYSTCFRQLGQLIENHSPLIESNPHLRVLISRFASSIAATPDYEMVSRLDQWLTSYKDNNNSNNDTTETNKDSKDHDKKHRHHYCGSRRAQRCGGRRRREIIASLPDDLTHFLLIGRHGRHHHHHHHHHHERRSGFMASLWGGDMHKHKYHRHDHDHDHDHEYSPYGPSSAYNPITSNPWGAHHPIFFGGRYGTKCSRADRHFEKAMKHHHHHRRHAYFFDAPTDSSSSSSSDSTSSSESEDDNKTTNVHQKEAGSKHQQKKFWKTMEKEQAHRSRRDHHHRHGSMPLFASRHPLFGHFPPPPGYIEKSFGQMHLNDSKN